MAYGLSKKCVKNLCKRTRLVQLIVKNMFFFVTQCTGTSVLAAILSDIPDDSDTNFIYILAAIERISTTQRRRTL